MGSKGGSGGGENAVEAARVAGEEARWLNREQTLANRPNQVNPWGSTEWLRTPIGEVAPSVGSVGGGSGGSYPQLGNVGGGEVMGPFPPAADGGPPAESGGYVGGSTSKWGDPIAGTSNWSPSTAEEQAALDAYYARFGGKPLPSAADVERNLKGRDIMNPDDAIIGGGSGSSGGGYSGGGYSGGGSGLTAEGTEAGLPAYQWTQVERLNPVLQEGLDAQFGQQRNRLQLAEQLSGQLGDQMGTPHDFDQYGDPIAFDPTAQRQAAEDAAYGRATSRLDPQFESQRQALDIQLRNRGLRAGDQQYESEMDRFARGRNDAYEQARMAATTEGRAETGLGLQLNQQANALRSQQIQEDLAKRGYTLQEINALMAGQEIEGSTPSAGENATIADMLSG